MLIAWYYHKLTAHTHTPAAVMIYDRVVFVIEKCNVWDWDEAARWRARVVCYAFIYAYPVYQRAASQQRMPPCAQRWQQVRACWEFYFSIFNFFLISFWLCNACCAHKSIMILSRAQEDDPIYGKLNWFNNVPKIGNISLQ